MASDSLVANRQGAHRLLERGDEPALEQQARIEPVRDLAYLLDRILDALTNPIETFADASVRGGLSSGGQPDANSGQPLLQAVMKVFSDSSSLVVHRMGD